MKTRLTIILLTLAGVQALGKIQIPFQKISVIPKHELEAVLQTPVAVPAAKFSYELDKDCRNFSKTMIELRHQSVALQISDYNDIRFRALALSMKPYYEIQLLAEKSLNLNPTFTSAKITNYEMQFNFSEEAISIATVQNTANDYISLQNFELDNYFILHFKSRDLFCDYYFGHLKISLNADLQLQTSQSLQQETEEKLNKILNDLNDGLKISRNKKIQAAYFGLSTYENSPKNWKEILNTSFAELINKEDFLPKPFWAEEHSDFYVLNFSRLHNISEQKIFLNGKFNE